MRIIAKKNDMFRPLIEALTHWLAYACESPYRLVECHKFIFTLAGKTRLDADSAVDPLLDGLIKALCDSFKQSEYKHETMRTISVIAVSFCKEKYVIDRMSDELIFKYTNIGSLMAANMLLAGHYKQAVGFISTLISSGELFEFRPFIAELAKVSKDELSLAAEDPLNAQMLRFMLQDGNRPTFEAYREYVLESIQNQMLPLCARVLMKLQTIFPDDPALYFNLWLSCKEPFEGREMILYPCLEGLCKYHANPYISEIRENNLFPRFLSMISCVKVTRALTDHTKEQE